MGNYIRFDWMIKRLLRDKRNYVVLDGFLSVLFGRQIKITQVLESEGNQETEDQKFNRVDLLVEDEKKEKILVEVQNDHELDFFQRMAFGASKIIADYMKKGEPYAALPKVYSVNIVYFSLGQGKGYAYHGTTVFKNMFNDEDELKLTPAQKSKFGVDEVLGIFPEYYILRVNKFDDEIRQPLQEWISFLKTGEIPDAFTAQGLKEARDILRVDALSEEDRKVYKRYLENVRLALSLDDSSRYEGYVDGHIAGRAEGRAEGEAKGRAEGRAEGELQKALEMAKKMLSDGMPIDLVAKYSGLTPDEISKI
ncbi:MAG: Rpn family recombination-promoting nuclease/putative transposase [Bacteroidales bacterium]|nr:Rpn family recombination-promoting nuclease/putative transposase [Bacteroidales bacterium]